MSGNVVSVSGKARSTVQKIDYPKMAGPRGRKIEHGVIRAWLHQYLGSGPTTGAPVAPTARPAGARHEITGEVIEKGRDVEN